MTDTESQLDLIETGPLPDEAAAEPQEEAAPKEAEEPEKVADAEETQEEAEDTVSEDSEEETEEDPKPRRRRNRTAKLAAKLTNAERQIAELQSQLQKVQPPAQEPAPAPKQEDFASFEEFTVASAQHVAREAARQEMQGLTQRVEKDMQQVQAQQLDAEWSKRESKASEKYDDYFEVVRDEDLQVSQTMADAIMQMDDGTDVAYHLGTHPDESARIAQLQPMAQVIELGRIAAKLSRPKPKSTTAPNPPKTVKSNSAPQALTLATAKTMDDYAKLRQPQIDKERGIVKP